MSDFNFDKNELQKMMNKASKKSGIDMQKLKQAADDGRLDDFLNQNFSADAGKKVKAALSDKKTAQKIIKSKEAQELLKKLLDK